MATIHLPPDFKEFLQLLNAHQVEYFLVNQLQFVDEQNGFSYYPPDVIDFYKGFDQRVGQTSSQYSTNDGGYSWVIVDPRVTP